MFRDAHQNVSPWRQKCAKIRNLQKYVVVVDVSLPPLASPTASPLFHKLVPARATCRPTLENALVSQPLNNARPPSGLPPALPRPPPSCVGKLLSYSLGTLAVFCCQLVCGAHANARGWPCGECHPPFCSSFTELNFLKWNE